MLRLRDYQQRACEAVFREWETVDSTLVVAPTGCHSPASKLLLYNGRIVAARDVREGMDLMGPGGTARRVLARHEGIAEMCRIVPVKGRPFVVSLDHVLALVRTRESTTSRRGVITDITVRDWLAWPRWQKHIHKLVRTDVEFATGLRPEWWQTFHIHPYLLGVMLGDGSMARHLSITTQDAEVVAAVTPLLAELRLRLSPSSSKCGAATCYLLCDAVRHGRAALNLRKWLQMLDLDGCRAGTKHIPHCYLTASSADRFDLLAGLMDTDGSATCGGYDFTSKSRRLADGTAFLARSLGFAAYVSPSCKTSQTGHGGVYYRVSISGDCARIPCRVASKRCGPRTQKRSVLRTGFAVERMGTGPFVGFTVDGDHRYLLDDFTVTHNCGKTILMCGIVQRVFPRRALILAHREELIFQAQDKIRRYTGIPAEVEMAGLRVDENQGRLFGGARVVVSSIQTQTAGGDGLGRMGKFDPGSFSVLIVDEAHHATADSYRRVLDYYRSNPALKVLGVTATPDRADEQALGQVFESVAFDYEILDAIHDGYLVPIRQRMVEVQGLDYSGVRTTAGDLNGADLARVMEGEDILHRLASPTVEIAGGRRTLVFATTVAHAERLAEILKRHGRNANWLCGKTPRDERRQIISEFAQGRLQFLVNVGCLTEGFDDPGVELVVIGRPTKSRCLYAQMVGRGTRPLPGVIDQLEMAPERIAAIAASGKPAVEVLDFAGNAGRHKLCTTADILGGRVSEEAAEVAVRAAREGGKPVDMEQLLAEAERESRAKAEREAARRARLLVQAQWQARTVDPFDVFALQPRREKGYERGKQLSEKQAELLRRQGIDPDGKPYHEMKQVLDELFRRWDQGLATFGQAKHLARLGLPTDLPKAIASQVLDGVWKLRLQPGQALERARDAARKLAEEVPF